MKGEYNDKIAFAAFLGAISVVMIHITVNANVGGLHWWLYQMTAQGLCRWAVPFFFATAGYFVACRTDEPAWWGRAVKKRCRTILVPFFCWNLIYFIVTTGLICAANYTHHRPLSDNMLSGWGCLSWIGLHPVHAPYNVTLWFLRTLFLLILTSPIYVQLIRRLGWLSLVILLALSYLRPVKLPFGYGFDCSLFFSAGIAARIRPIVVNRKFALSLAIGLLWIAVDKYIRLRSGVNCGGESLPLPAVCLMVIGIWLLVPTIKLPDYLKHATFPIYLIHVFPLMMWNFVFGPPKTEWLAVVIWVYCLGVCIALQWCLFRCSPRAARILFGGR